ncbi:glycoside hydrolase family 6 protein [Cryobacterium breve]|uniref:Glucanase n=1 Tax=Cryobacterium breve TaxID=1259258 RepID=A0ABY7NDZ1_9MICO|nr:glycoside hydrolase family 6 protein [Cryobacterium breve]WBM79769.1 glycoside hydrolase family 6 protein [Cryobacterium breve]
MNFRSRLVRTLLPVLLGVLGLVLVLVVALVALPQRPDSAGTESGSGQSPSPAASDPGAAPAAEPGAADPDTDPDAPGDATAAATSNVYFPGGFYREPDTPADAAVARLRAAGDTASAGLVQQIASQPTAIWLGDWYSDALLTTLVKRHAAAARQQGTTLVLVTYAIPNRDCGGYSAGGHGYDTYLAWNRTIVAALGGTRAVILVEPDSLSMLASPNCAGEAAKRLPLIRGAIDILHAAGNRTYLDGGNSNWLTPTAQASWLTQAGIAAADGFFTNVSNFYPVQAEQDYAGKVSSRVGWKHFVIDVSRNGKGWLGTWCNPPGAGLGANPTADTGAVKLDALLWVKHPGLSDGTCNGGPAAGTWFESYALDLARNR